MANSLALGASNQIAGLGTFIGTVTTAGFYSVQVQSTIPHDSGSSLNSAQSSSQASALQIVVKQNASTMLTAGGSATNPTPSQATLGGSVDLQCVAGDTISVILSSANAIDNQPNTVKTVANVIYNGA